ncbi:type II secretion system protein E (GspE) [Rhodoblastus acidophilus]|uniref:Type II secretion system protein E (GspE) n=1 Tax=Rhodoblastus acidophilus TaxID=1074 RepID=A0A212SAY0_RHOAC|nr:GspE/PulE family protein [Rhodoblastus acidophilus]SNB82551.1 type II secretion system protein E (GspE) [Rhodoblastus acidophilus]
MTVQTVSRGAPDGFAEEFGAFLQGQDALDERALQRVLRVARQSGERFDRVLTKLGLIAEADLAAHLAAFLNLSEVTPTNALVDIAASELAPQKFLRANCVLPLRAEGERLSVAVIDPFDHDALDALAYATGLNIERRLASPAVFEQLWAQVFGVGHGATEALGQDLRADEASEVDLQRLRDIANEAPVVRRVNQIIADAIEARATDIHMEPKPAGVQLRYRIDGALQTIDVLPPGLKAAIASRIKIMARLDIAERRLPQDGGITLPIRGVDIDFRVSTLPTVHGESIVLRIFDRSRVVLDFEELGFEPHTIAALRDIMRLPNGFVLVTGPTGSGKTTTLYTVLRELARPDVKIFTVEDPVEYQLAGINQVQVQPAIGFGFPEALRAILRQDPDIVMIGEIRDAQTARIAIQASLTGHLVFSTLHTNSASASITRLIDMGVENYLIATTVKAVVAQRLVRRLCQACAEPLAEADAWRERLSAEIVCETPPRLLGPNGCPQCRGLGYSGLSTISELLVTNERLQRLVCQNVAGSELEAAARASGMITMYQSGMRKAWSGETSVDEVLRETRIG